MKKQFIELVIFFFLLILGAFLVVLFLNMPNITRLVEEPLEITPDSDYSIAEIDQGERIRIIGTKNNIFSSTNSDESLSFFALEEYLFDFILIVENGDSQENEYLCTNISESENGLLNDLVTQFNQPIDPDSLFEDSDSILNSNGTQIIEENTVGNFGDRTILLDCTVSDNRTNLEIFFFMGVEFVVLSGALLYLFRNKFREFERMVEEHEY